MSQPDIRTLPGVADTESGALRWSQIALAAALMAATMPGRTHGLALITEPVLRESGIGHDAYAIWNAVATFLGAFACPVAGWLYDRFGLRIPTGFVLALLAGAAFLMTAVPLHGLALGFGLGLVATRATGQGALSVSSITLMGRWGKERTGPEMAVYGILMTMIMAVLFGVAGEVIRTQGWRAAWQGISLGVLVLGAVSFLAVREPGRVRANVEPVEGFAGNALRTPVFWIYAVTTSLFGLAASGFGLFGEGIFRQFGHSQETFHTSLVAGLGFGLLGNALCGVLGRFLPPRVLLGIATALYALGLGGFLIFGHSTGGLWTLIAFNGISGGILTVMFFSLWAQTFGQRRLGKVQGAAQACTVVASAAGPLVFSRSFEATGNYSAALVGCMAILLAGAAVCIFGNLLGLKFQVST